MAAKAARRGMQTPGTIIAAPTTAAVAAPATTEAPAPASAPTDLDASRPLPRNRALAKPRGRMMLMIDRFFRWPARRTRSGAEVTQEQLQAVRVQLAGAQLMIERMLQQNC